MPLKQGILQVQDGLPLFHTRGLAELFDGSLPACC